MANESRKTVIPKSPLRLMPSVRKNAKLFSAKEGVSLNQFINLAVAEKLAHMEHEGWVLNRKRPTKELAARALSLLDKADNKPAEPGDALPKGYLPKSRYGNRSTMNQRNGSPRDRVSSWPIAGCATGETDQCGSRGAYQRVHPGR